ncbi:hypothetical protein [Vibrio sp. Hal054]|uniref:hypothetical protein n=1 Tax=Vibrio sp. Hal054 TaxID=3035158 RepID=UPI00301CAA5E
MSATMVEFVKNESATSELERNFQSWCNEVAKQMGTLIDNDWAFDLFADGCSVEDAVVEMTPK